MMAKKRIGVDIERDKPGMYKNEDGIAVILALIMLLVMSVLALTVSFSSNVDFRAMSNYKQGQESFLAAERCIQEARNRFEVIGVETLFFLLQGLQGGALGTGTSNDLTINLDMDNGAFCRTGPRLWDNPPAGGEDCDSDTVGTKPAPLIEVPPPTKVNARPIKNVSLPSGGVGAAGLIPVAFQVTGKDSADDDKKDCNNNINTGTEIAVGLESFIPGGASNVYSAQ